MLPDKMKGSPPLPDEEPPLPNEPTPVVEPEDDGWEPRWSDEHQTWFFFNRFTQLSQWENPRVPDATTTGPTLVDKGPPGAENSTHSSRPVAGGYDPAIHGDYDPNADYAKAYEEAKETKNPDTALAADQAALYTATGQFNRFTGKWQNADLNPERYNDENKSKRQMNAFFDVDAAANSHDGRSLKAERQSKKLSKADLKRYREKRKEKTEKKKRQWLLND